MKGLEKLPNGGGRELEVKRRRPNSREGLSEVKPEELVIDAKSGFLDFPSHGEVWRQ